MQNYNEIVQNYKPTHLTLKLRIMYNSICEELLVWRRTNEL